MNIVSTKSSERRKLCTKNVFFPENPDDNNIVDFFGNLIKQLDSDISLFRPDLHDPEELQDILDQLEILYLNTEKDEAFLLHYIKFMSGILHAVAIYTLRRDQNPVKILSNMQTSPGFYDIPIPLLDFLITALPILLISSDKVDNIIFSHIFHALQLQ